MKRLNITIPNELNQELETIPNKSRFIAEALREKLERGKKRKLETLLIEGYKATKKEDKKVNQEWEQVAMEGWS